MSYLDTPRLHFAGTFTASPSTINNTPSNYYDPATQAEPPISLSWNPYGSHVFTISAKVQSFVDSEGCVHTSGDPLIGATFESYVPHAPAKLVDLDTEQQGVTRLFGLNLQLTLDGAGKPVLQGLWDDAGTLINLWARVPTLDPQNPPDSAFGGAFQSVLGNLVWQDTSGSTLLSQVQKGAGGEGAQLSVRMNLYAYQDSSTSPGFRTGLISGTIGPQLAGEPLHLAPRLLSPTTTSQLFYAPAKVNGTTVTFDLGNSIPDQNPGGPPASGLTIQAAAGAGAKPDILGTVDYEGETFGKTSGVVQFPITKEQAGQPLSILVNGAPALAENANGLYIDVDGSSLYLNPKEEAAVNVWATQFGQPAPGTEVALALTPQPLPPGADFNQPPDGVSFPGSVTTGSNGAAAVQLKAKDTFFRESMPSGRQSIGGQLYFIGGDWAAGNVAAAPLNVKLFNTVQQSATWGNVQPILYRFYYMYGFMASIVDLSNYGEVVANAQRIRQVLSADIHDPAYMPVSRELAGDERQLILTWIANGCPR